MEPISLGLTALSVGSSLFGLFGQQSHIDPTTSMMNTFLAARSNELAQQENAIRRTQMNLDAERRKRDVVRNAQIAQANATAVGFNQGAGNSSALAGAKNSISSQADTMMVGINKNQQLGGALFDTMNEQATTRYMFNKTQQQLNAQAQTPNTLAQAGTMMGNIVSNNQEDLTKLFKFGFGQGQSAIKSF